MCFKRCTNCGEEFQHSKAAEHNCDWALKPRPWQAMETVNNGGDTQVLIEYLAAEMDVLRQHIQRIEAD